MSQKLVKKKLAKYWSKIGQKLCELGDKMRYFWSYIVFNIQDDRHRKLKYFDKII